MARRDPKPEAQANGKSTAAAARQLPVVAAERDRFRRRVAKPARMRCAAKRLG